MKLLARNFTIVQIPALVTLWISSNSSHGVRIASYATRDNIFANKDGVDECWATSRERTHRIRASREPKKCDWIAATNRRRKKKCRKPKNQKRCPETCKMERCQARAYPRGKKGVAFTLREDGKRGSYRENLPKMRALNPSWAYSWGPSPPSGVPVASLLGGGIEITGGGSGGSIDYLPMLWGYYPNKFDDFTDQILAQNPRIVLGFNEPDSPEQSNLSINAALGGWERLVRKLGPNEDYLLVSPSCVNPLNDWCQTFIDGVDGANLRLDAIGVHHYGGINPQGFMDKLREVYERYGYRPIVVTEFAVADWTATGRDDNRFTPEQVLGFMKAVLPWMEDQDWILGYSWFSFESTSAAGWVSSLVRETDETTGSVALTPLGEYYAAFGKPSGSGGSGNDGLQRPNPDVQEDVTVNINK